MKENPNPDGETEDQFYQGDNQHRFTGAYLDLIQQQRFINEAQQRGGVDLN
jgi:hypothetical protein